MAATNFFGGSFFDSGFFGAGVNVDVLPTGGGGGYKNNAPLPQYYSRRVLDERISLPQDRKSNEVAISVLDDAKDIEKRLAKDDRDFADMLEQTGHMLKQTATYIESQQISQKFRQGVMQILQILSGRFKRLLTMLNSRNWLT